MQQYLKHFTHLDPIQSCNFRAGGLTFSQSEFSMGPLEITIQHERCEDYEQIATNQRLEGNGIMADIDKPVVMEMGQKEKWPIAIEKLVIVDCHQQLSNITNGIIDMVIPDHLVQIEWLSRLNSNV